MTKQNVYTKNVNYCEECQYFDRPPFQFATSEPDLRCSQTNSKLEFTYYTNCMKTIENGIMSITGTFPFIHIIIPADCPLEDI